MQDDEHQIPTLLQSPLRIINIGLAGFADDLERQQIEVIDVDWSPPAGGNPEMVELLAKLGI